MKFKLGHPTLYMGPLKLKYHVFKDCICRILISQLLSTSLLQFQGLILILFFFHSLSLSVESPPAPTMAAWKVAARQVSNLARLSTPKSASSTTQVSSLIQRRSFAAGGGNLRLIHFFFLLYILNFIDKYL